jgi:pimeloyl-ACP methyl ester carboxylesterase
MEESYAALISNLKKAAQGFGRIEPASGPATTRAVRRSRRPRDSKVVRVQLVSVDGLLDWRTPTTPRIAGPPRRRGTTRSGAGHLVAEAEFPRLPPSEITAFLQKWDTRLTPRRGLRQWNPRQQALYAEATTAPSAGRALLLIHGTFSNGDNNFEAIRATPEGQEFLKDAEKKYNGQIYSFDHPTVSVGPILNAIDLAVLFRDSKAKVDVISHSRGGLVTRWFDQLHRLNPGVGKAILVGSPLGGTSLAAPPNLRRTIRLLTNVGHVAEKVVSLASFAVPMLTLVEGLLTIVTSVASWTASTPVIDAVVAMVPGWFAQSRVGNNPELLRLLESKLHEPGRYYFVISNFESPDPGWAFWRRFRRSNIADFASDMIFPDLNDLVVDTESMTSLAIKKMKIPASQILDFKTSPDVHHLNYFQQPKTIEFLAQQLLAAR